MSPYFFFSYAHGEDAEFFEKFYEDLRKEVAERTTLATADVGFRDTSGIGLGQPWGPELVHALRTCECFVPMLAPRLAVSSYCGKEWSVFRDRLRACAAAGPGHPTRLLPVLWRPLDQEIPKVIRDTQYLHDEFGPAYAEKGLLTLLKLQRYKDEYQTFLQAFADTMVRAVKSVRLPPFNEELDMDSIPDAFCLSQTPLTANVPAEPAMDQILLVVAAGAESELRKIRQEVSAYGKSWVQWRPFPSRSPETAVAVAQGALAGENLSTFPVPFDDKVVGQLKQILERETSAQGGIFVILLDPWSIDVPPYETSMRWFDKQRFLGGAVLQVWPKDEETRERTEDVRARVRGVIPALSATGSSTSLFGVVADRERFGQELVKIVAGIQGRILETWGDLKVIGGKATTLPQLQGPAV